jgi:uncharacterized protein
LIVHRSKMPGADESTPLLAVTRGTAGTAGTAGTGAIQTLTPADLLTAWRPS